MIDFSLPSGLLARKVFCSNRANAVGLLLMKRFILSVHLTLIDVFRKWRRSHRQHPPTHTTTSNKHDTLTQQQA